MREYSGPGEIIREVVFVAGDRPRLAAATGAAVFVWDLDAPAKPAIVRSFGIPGRRPVLTVAGDGRWLATGSTETLEISEMSPAAKTSSVKAPGLLAAQWVGGELRWIGTEAGELYHRSIKLAERGRKAKPSAPVVLAGVADMKAGLPGADLDRVFRLRPVTDLSPDGRRVSMSGFEKVVHLWDAGTGAALGDIPFRGFPCAVLFSPDGSRLAVESGTTVYVHDAASRELPAKWTVRPCDIPGLAWSPDGRLLARADNSTTVRVYDAMTGRERMAVGEKRGRYVCVAFAPDGLTFAAGSWSGPVRVWDLDA
jgi:WD40 repeat protein